MTNTYEWWSAIIDTNYIFIANYYAFPVYIFFGQIRYLNIRHERTLTWSPLMLKCSERCRETQQREPAHTGWCLVIQPQNFHDISRYGHNRIDLPPYFCSDGLYDVPPSHLDTFILSLSGYSFVSRVFISAKLSIWHRIFRTLLTSDNSSSKTSQWHIMKLYLPTLKHLVIQLTKLQIYTLNLTTTFWHCKKKSHYFWTGVYIIQHTWYNQQVHIMIQNNCMKYPWTMFSSLRPSDTYMRHETKPSLIQIVACRLAGASHHLKQCGIMWIGPWGINFNNILVEIHHSSCSWSSAARWNRQKGCTLIRVSKYIMGPLFISKPCFEYMVQCEFHEVTTHIIECVSNAKWAQSVFS